ncbi:DUF4304 domain-containing protein [Planctomicrobium piriforme]|uniref:DUF4304 domain-containing protein n=1 Tax=Planctomicrobium piriforme TaxID=1576369 RepID=A0A1I3P2E5_9PLAN|nr:DUF4304 domain-containing protein [Planctomicrobium piriforme]SFJ15562.1 protein of unknown function [Planctomicrobium piriforme]
MSQPTIFTTTFGRSLKPAGYKKLRGDTWYKFNKDTICLVNIQKSDWGNEWFVNLAVWINGIEKSNIPPISSFFKKYVKRLYPERPLHNHCQLQVRWEVLAPERKNLLMLAMRLYDNSLSDADRIPILTEMLENTVIPFLERASSFKGLKSIISDDRIKNHFWEIAMPFLEEQIAAKGSDRG